MMRFYLTTYFLVTGARDTDLVTTSQVWEGTGAARIRTTVTRTRSWTLRARAVPSLTTWTQAGTETGAARRAGARRTRWPRRPCPRYRGVSTTQAGQHIRHSPVWPAARDRPKASPQRPLLASTKLHRSSGDLTRYDRPCPRPPPTPWTLSPRSPSRSPSPAYRATSSSCPPRRPRSRRLEVRCSVSGAPRDLNIFSQQEPGVPRVTMIWVMSSQTFLEEKIGNIFFHRWDKMECCAECFSVSS